MKSWLVLLLIPSLQAAETVPETVLYDVDYSQCFPSLGQSIPVGDGPYPGRTTCSAINFGAAEIGLMPAVDEPLKTAAILRTASTGTGPGIFYSQLEFRLGWQVYAFRKHRLEMTFRLPAGFSGPDEFSISTDGGVTYSLRFRGGFTTSRLSGNVAKLRPPWGLQVVTEDTDSASYSPAETIHLVWESDASAGTTSVTINGNTVSRDGLSVLGLGTRNWKVIPGPLFIRLNLSCSPHNSGLALQSFRLIGSDYDGPLYDSTPGRDFAPEVDFATIPLSVPATGTWQPEYSINGADWVPFGAPLNSSYPIQRVVFGTRVAPQMSFRFKEAE